MQAEGDQQSSDRQANEIDEERQRRESETEADAPEDRPGEPGAEGGSHSPTRDKLPGMPAKGDPTPVGDTDQHSTD
jgi:hypothetical protein